jgi:CheY-like chemotaxis protein
MEHVDKETALISFTLQPGSLPLGWERTEPMMHHIAGKRILVIEEKQSKRELLKAQLIAGGLRSTGVTNGVDALALLRLEAGKRDPFAAAVIAVQMPDMNAVTFAKILKSDPELGSTHLLVKHAFGEKLEMDTYHKAGVEASISTPVQQSQLFSTLARLLAEPSAPIEHSSGETFDRLTRTTPILAFQASTHFEIQSSANGS